MEQMSKAEWQYYLHVQLGNKYPLSDAARLWREVQLERFSMTDRPKDTQPVDGNSVEVYGMEQVMYACRRRNDFTYVSDVGMSVEDKPVIDIVISGTRLRLSITEGIRRDERDNRTN